MYVYTGGGGGGVNDRDLLKDSWVILVSPYEDLGNGSQCLNNGLFVVVCDRWISQQHLILVSSYRAQSSNKGVIGTCRQLITEFHTWYAKICNLLFLKHTTYTAKALTQHLVTPLFIKLKHMHSRHALSTLLSSCTAQKHYHHDHRATAELSSMAEFVFKAKLKFYDLSLLELVYGELFLGFP